MLPPADIVAEIKAKSGSEVPNEPKEEVKTNSTEHADGDGKAPKSDGKADKDVKKPVNGQSIAQVADDIATQEDEDDDSEDDHGDDKSKKRGSVFKELLDTRKELKEMRKDEKSRAEREVKMMGIITDLADRIEDMQRSGVKVSQEEKDELEQLIEEQGLDADGTRKFVKILEKKFGRPLNDKKEEKKEPEKEKQDAPKGIDNSRAVELAIEAEYEEITKAFPQLKNATNLKAVKLFVLSDPENRDKSMEEVIREMYPSVLGENQTMDGYNPNAIIDEEKIDFQDPKVISKLESDPKLRKKAQDDLLARVQGQYFRRQD